MVETAARMGLPVVVVDRRMRDIEVDTVISDNFNAAARAVAHLISLGNRRVGIISGPLHLSSARDRYSGYLHALSEHGVTIDSSLTRFGNFKLNSGYQAALELLAMAKPPSAVFVANNEMTIGALNAIHEQGRRIPDDIAVIGFDDFPWAISLNPPLTTVAQSADEIGRRAAELLLERLADPAAPARTVTLDTELVVRASCGSTRGASAAAPPDRTLTDTKGD